MSQTSATTRNQTAAESVTGVQLMQGEGVQPSKGFWGDAWDQVLRKPAAIFALTWIGIVAFFACFAPLIASGHPIRLKVVETGQTFSPMLRMLSTPDVLLALGGLAVLPWMLIGRSAAGEGRSRPRLIAAGLIALAAVLGVARLIAGIAADADPESMLASYWTVWNPWFMLLLAASAWLLLAFSLPKGTHLRTFFFAAIQAGLIAVLTAVVSGFTEARDAPDWVRNLQRDYTGTFAPMGAAIIAVIVSLPFVFIPTVRRFGSRVAVVATICIVAALASAHGWYPKSTSFDYIEREQAGQIEATYTLVPWSPTQRDTRLYHKAPGMSFSEAVGDEHAGEEGAARDPIFIAGTDSLGQDVFSQMLHASRLSISIGLVSTGIAVVIGVTLGALMGYFGSWVDLTLYRVVEIFMSIPVLFILIVAAGVLPRNTYIIMAIIGLFTWMNFARYTRAEFFKLRDQDFVQSARAVGLPLPSVLFKHMLPNGVTPVLVEASFAIALAILFESILSFLGLGPADQPSWGGLLADARTQGGRFMLHLALIPGITITVTVLSLVLISESLRDAIDPKLKKARV